jgi:glucose/arabinose dehydrogenase
MQTHCDLPPPFMKIRLLQLILGLCLAGAATSPAENRVQLVDTWKNITFHIPVALTIPPDGTDRLFLLDLDGHVYILPQDRDSSKAAVFLDLSERKLTARTQRFTEEGLLGLAFHPRFAENGKFYVNYTVQDPRRSVVSEFTVSESDPNRADPSSERILLEVRQPFWNHNSGNMLFGPADGFLYIALGDGGLRNDARRFAQNLFVMNGKILRIDVDGRTGALAYGIPADNPFVNQDGVLPEIWAYGLRNPWGMWIDPETGFFWCADVGQDLWEEINLIDKGGNYGWSLFEGMQRFGERFDEPLPEGIEFSEPILAYGRDLGFSITGGYVYRGRNLPALREHYVYGDFKAGRIWALTLNGDTKQVVSNELIFEKPEPGAKGGFQPNAFCADPSGEILALSWDGKIYAIEPK